MKKPPLKREKAWKLYQLTCAELAERVAGAIPADMKENKANAALRRRYSSPKQLEKLKICKTFSASYHAAYVKTASHFLKVPTLVLTCTGGKPKANSMPPYSKSLKKLGELNGVVIHRFDKRAFIMAHPLKNNL